MRNPFRAHSALQGIPLAAALVLPAGCRHALVSEKEAEGMVTGARVDISRADDTMTRVGVSSSGGEADGHTFLASISADGRFVAFASSATNLVPGDTGGHEDVFVHDRETGRTERVSVSPSGGEANGSSGFLSISADGRFVVFVSRAMNLVLGDTNSRMDVFVRDRETGLTERLSVSSAGAEANGDSYHPSISADGRFVAFESEATDLVPGDTNDCWDVFVRDRRTGLTVRVGVDSAGAQAIGNCGEPAISADGRFVAFWYGVGSGRPRDTDDRGDIFVHDRKTGRTEKVSVSSSGGGANNGSKWPSISADGRSVAFCSDATNLVPGDTNGCWDAFIHDRESGRTERVSVSSCGGQADGASWVASISVDGRFVALSSFATNLLPGGTSGRQKTIFVRDRDTGRTARVTVGSAGVEADGYSQWPAISADARFVAFLSCATNLVPGDTNDEWDVFVVRNPLAPRRRRRRGPPASASAVVGAAVSCHAAPLTPATSVRE